MRIEIIPVEGLGEVQAGDDLAADLLAAVGKSGERLADGDVVVITHKIISKQQGAVAPAVDDAAYRALVEREAAAVLRRRGTLVITETRHGFVCANAGVDRSNMPPGKAALLPPDPDGSAHAIRTRLERDTGRRLAVVITDTFGRAWRRGQTDVALGVSGIPALLDLRGTLDALGRELTATETAFADEVAAGADLVMGKDRNIPACIVRGLEYPPQQGKGADLVRDPSEDLFR